MMKNTKRMEEKVNAIVDEILDEDQGNDFSVTRSESCPRDCEEPDDTSKEISRKCKCGVENSTRFSLRVLEAMRSLQRDVDHPPTSSADDIVDYIRRNYRHDGDLYAQVRTALKQVCSQGYVMELFNNEYHLVGPVVSAMKPNCSWDCKGRTAIDDTSRRRRGLNNHRNGVCRCKRFFRRNGSPEDARLPRKESLGRTFVIDHDENLITEPRFYSTRISANERNNADYYRDTELGTEELLSSCGCNDTLDVRDDRRQRDITGVREIERDEYAEPVPGPSRVRALSPVPTRKVKEARLEDRIVQRVDANDEETTTEEDIDCTCDTNKVAQDEHSKRRPRVDRNRVVIRNQRNGQRRENDEEEDEEDEERVDEEEDEDTEDSAYRELRVRVPRIRRNAVRERELKRWIRRCRQECERRRAQ